MTKRVMRILTPSPPLVTLWGIALLGSEKAEALVDSLEAQFQPITTPSVPAVIEKVNVQLESYLQTPASEPLLTDPDEVQNAIRGLKVSKAPGSNGIPNRALKHLPIQGVTPPCPSFQLNPPHPALSSGLEACPSDLHSETREGSGTALLLSAH